MEVSIKSEIARRNMKYKDVAAAVNIPTVTFYKKLKNNSFSLSEAAKVLGVLGLKLVLVSK